MSITSKLQNCSPVLQEAYGRMVLFIHRFYSSPKSGQIECLKEILRDVAFGKCEKWFYMDDVYKFLTNDFKEYYLRPKLHIVLAEMAKQVDCTPMEYVNWIGCKYRSNDLLWRLFSGDEQAYVLVFRAMAENLLTVFESEVSNED